MYLDCLVKMPNVPGKIVCQKKGETTYVYYETDRTYDPEKRYTAPKRMHSLTVQYLMGRTSV